jgi:signal transduction histidine kinase
VIDDGSGIDEHETRQDGLGLVNLRSRAEELHGRFVIEPRKTGGTTIIWEVPANQA